MAAVAGEEVGSSNTEGSRLFKLCRGFYSSIKNEKKNLISVLIYHMLALDSSNWWLEKEDRGEG